MSNTNTRAQPATAAAAANSAANHSQGGCICCLLFCTGILIMVIIFGLAGAFPFYKAHSHGPPPPPPPPAEVQLTSLSVSTSSNSTSLLDDAVWVLTLHVAFLQATPATVVHYDSFRASVLFDSGGGRGPAEMARATAPVPSPFEAKADSTFNLRLESKPAAERMSGEERMVFGAILDDVVAAGSVDFGVRVVAAVRVDGLAKQKETMVAMVRADCYPVRIGFPGLYTAGGGLSGSLPISITCDVR